MADPGSKVSEEKKHGKMAVCQEETQLNRAFISY